MHYKMEILSTTVYEIFLCKLQKGLPSIFQVAACSSCDTKILFERYRNMISKEISSFNTDVSKSIHYLAQQGSAGSIETSKLSPS